MTQQPVGPSDRLLRVDALRTWFPTGRGDVRAVDGVTFELSDGETLGIVGESGSGKSAVARSIMRLLPRHAMTDGTVTFMGRDVASLDDRQRRQIWGAEVAMIFQDPATSLNPVQRVGRQLAEPLMLHLGLKGRAAKVRTLELLDAVGIPDPESRVRAYPFELSGGMRQRISIALAISCYPRLLLADEPTTALDVTIQRQILDLLTGLQQRHGMALILISHDLGVVARRTDRIMVMYGGRVVEQAPTRVLFSEPRHPYTAALLASIPRLEHRSHTRLAVIPGRPVDVIDPGPGCRFAPRCQHARPRCLAEDPATTTGADQQHAFACFYPVGLEAGSSALKANLAEGRTAAGLTLATAGMVH